MDLENLRRISRATTTSLGTLDDKELAAIENTNDTTPQFSHKIVVAIDFGTTYRYNYNIHMNEVISISLFLQNVIRVILNNQSKICYCISGYAYSFTQEPENIHIMRKWEGDDPGINNQKTPTILLLTPNKVL